MRKIRKFILMIFAAVMVSAFGADISAEDISSLADDYGIGEISRELPSEAAEFLEEKGISPDDPQSVMSLSPALVLEYMWEKVKDNAAEPLRIFAAVTALVVMAAAVGSVSEISDGGSSEQLCRIITVLAAAAAVIPTVSRCVDNAAADMESGSDFMLCYVPVFASVAAAAGNAAASLGYNAVVLLAAEAAVRVAADVIMPVISICIAMSIINAVNPAFSLGSLTVFMRKWISLLLGFIMTLFTGLLSIQSIVGASADTLGVKAAKFMVSNLVPVVGSAVADAYTTMRSGLGLLRGAAGAFGIIAAVVILLPPILESGLIYLAMSAGEALAEMMGIKELAVFFKGTASALSLLIAVISCFAVMFIISTIILMSAVSAGG